jgi:hypothetical protein
MINFIFLLIMLINRHNKTFLTEVLLLFYSFSEYRQINKISLCKFITISLIEHVIKFSL